MRRVIARSAMATKQANRKHANKEAWKRASTDKTQRKNLFSQERAEARMIRTARQHQREDWMLGPLAPKRDAGPDRDTYGAMDPRAHSNFPLPSKTRDARAADHIVVGDRVVLLEGRDRGKIGEVASVDRESQTCKVKGLNMAITPHPEHLRQTEANSPALSEPLPHAIPLPSVRLVHVLHFPNPDGTSTPRDVVVAELRVRPSPAARSKQPTHPAHRDPTVDTRPIRTIPGLARFRDRTWKETGALAPPDPETVDPEKGSQEALRWASAGGAMLYEPLAAPAATAAPDDTVRLDAEAETFVPPLASEPMPGAVLDELRGRYSAFRDRHEEAYLRRKAAEDQRENWRRRTQRDGRVVGAAELLATEKDGAPRVKGRGEVRELRKRKGKLDEERLARIGEMVERMRQGQGATATAATATA